VSGLASLREVAGWTTTGDRVLIALLLVASAVGAVWVGRAPEGGLAIVQSDDRIEGEYPLTEPRRLRVTGPLGETEITIEDGAARIVASPCPRKECVRMGAARRTGQTIVCVPNKVIVRVEGERAGSDDVDAILH
jgi:hypothetical protein